MASIAIRSLLMYVVISLNFDLWKRSFLPLMFSVAMLIACLFPRFFFSVSSSLSIACLRVTSRSMVSDVSDVFSSVVSLSRWLHSILPRGICPSMESLVSWPSSWLSRAWVRGRPLPPGDFERRFILLASGHKLAGATVAPLLPSRGSRRPEVVRDVFRLCLSIVFWFCLCIFAVFCFLGSILLSFSCFFCFLRFLVFLVD